MTTVSQPNNSLDASADRSWTSATTATIGNALHAAQDLVHKVESTAKEYAQSAKDQVVGAGSKVSQTLSRALSSDALDECEKKAESVREPNAGEPESPSPRHLASPVLSPELQPSQKKARIYTSRSDSMDKVPPVDLTTGLEANLDPALCGPQRLAAASPQPMVDKNKAVNKQTAALLGHKRADSAEKYWKAPDFE